MTRRHKHLPLCNIGVCDTSKYDEVETVTPASSDAAGPFVWNFLYYILRFFWIF